MKICMTGNSVPFGEGHAYGGERIIQYLSQELGKLGHEVYLFAQKGTNVPGVKDYIPVAPIRNDMDVHYAEIKKYIDRTKIDFDVYQCNYFGDGWDREILDRFNYCELTWCAWCHIGHQLKLVPYNTISYSNSLKKDFDECRMPTLRIYYGVPKDLYQCNPCKKDYICWIGKCEGGKAPGMAVKIAKAAGKKIVFMCPPYNTNTFWAEIAPHIDNVNVFWVRGVDDRMKMKIMSEAQCLLYTCSNSWREHFGIVFIEALAMGTPVVGMCRNGHENSLVLDNIIEDGKHGFVLRHNNSEDACEVIEKALPLIKQVESISPVDCREHFETHFAADLMAKRYEYLYNQIQNGRKIYKNEIHF